MMGVDDEELVGVGVGVDAGVVGGDGVVIGAELVGAVDG